MQFECFVEHHVVRIHPLTIELVLWFARIATKSPESYKLFPPTVAEALYLTNSVERKLSGQLSLSYNHCKHVCKHVCKQVCVQPIMSLCYDMLIKGL